MYAHWLLYPENWNQCRWIDWSETRRNLDVPWYFKQVIKVKNKNWNSRNGIYLHSQQMFCLQEACWCEQEWKMMHLYPGMVDHCSLEMQAVSMSKRLQAPSDCLLQILIDKKNSMKQKHFWTEACNWTTVAAGIKMLILI